MLFAPDLAGLDGSRLDFGAQFETWANAAWSGRTYNRGVD